jgi:FtsZ-binding cell division protein ZapB
VQLYEKYGADVLLFGNSELSRNIILSELLPTKLGAKKILSCATFGMLTEHVLKTATKMADIPTKKAHVVIWGYSLWNAYTNSKAFKKIRQEKAVKESASTLASIHDAKISSYLAPPSWDDVFPLNLKSYRDRKILYSEQGLVDSWASVARYPVAKELLQDNAKVSQALQTQHLAHLFLEGISEKDCDLTQATSQFEDTLNELKKLSDKIIIYLTPTTPDYEALAPKCFKSALLKMLLAKRSETFVVLTKNWNDYGLNYEDFVDHTLKGLADSRVLINLNHPNFTGAHKITEKLRHDLFEL